jgi:UDP-N-acetylmuramyl pentapeptide phosphotransferase/UDP-N-acetylglucosamine-1-phosphate transferase
MCARIVALPFEMEFSAADPCELAAEFGLLVAKMTVLASLSDIPIESMVTFSAAFLITVLVCFPLHRYLLRFNVLAYPNERSSHTKPTATSAGIAIILAIELLGLYWFWRTHSYIYLFLLIAIAIGGVVSFGDNRRSPSVGLRLGCHVLLGVCGTGILIRANSAEDWVWSLLVGLVGMLWLVGYANAFNFMDGINGLATGQAMLTSLGTALLAVSSGAQWTDPSIFCCLSLAGGAAGFLPHNFPRARMFMGDVGSIPLGFTIAFVCMWVAFQYGSDLIVPLVLLQANFVLDTTITLGRRIYRHKRWLEPHREHFYQRMARSGRSHTVVTLVEMTLQFIVIGLTIRYLQADFLLRLSLMVLVLGLWISFFLLCELTFRRAFDGPDAQSPTEVTRTTA